MPKKSDKIVLISPAGEAVFPHLTLDDVDFGTDEFPKEDGEYNCKLRMPLEEAEDFLAKLEPLHKAAIEAGKKEDKKRKPANRKKNPFKIHPLYEEVLDDETEEPTGDVIFNFKTKYSGTSKKTGKEWTRTLSIYDAKKNVINSTDLKIWGGSILKLACSPKAFWVAGTGLAGLTLYLEAVQVIELRGPGQRSADSFGFGEEDGYEHDEGDVNTKAGEDGEDADESGDDEIPDF